MTAFCEARRQQFIAAMDDDLNTADAIAALFELAKDCNLMAAGAPTKGGCELALSTFNELADVLGLLYSRAAEGDDDAEIEALIAARTQARAAKNWAESDRIRDELKARGVVVEDTSQGVKWHRA